MVKNKERIQDLEDEVWRDIQGYEGLYQVSNKGRVKVLPRILDTLDNRKKHIGERLKTTSPNQHGHLKVNLQINHTRSDIYRPYLVSRLVATAFIPNPNSHRFVEHCDGNSLNNCSSNLKWVHQYTEKTHRTHDNDFFLGTIEGEQWKHIKGHEDFYMISSEGRVKSLLENKIRKPSKHYKVGYYKVDIRQPFRKTYMIHRLVAEHFIPNPENKRTVNHIDGNKLNNSVGNLEWLTQKENMQHYHQSTKATKSAD